VDIKIKEKRESNAPFVITTARNVQSKRENNTHLFHILAHPQRDRCTPVPVPRHVPVARVREPVPETAFADVLRDPACFLVVRDEEIDDGLDADEPDGDGAVD
jgi:hypothetical protein